MAGNSGLSTASFLGGAMQGANFMQGMQDAELRRDEIKANRGLREVEERRRQESHSAQMKAHEEGTRLRGLQINQINEDNARKMNQALAWSLYNAKDMPAEYQELVAAMPNLNAQRLLSDEFGGALETAKSALTGKIDYNSPEALNALAVLNPELQLGATGGRKVKPARILPGRNPGTIMIGLSVDGDDRIRPLTERRSADDDDPVKEIPVDALIQRVMTMEKYREMLADPKGREWFINSNLPEGVRKSKNSQWSDIQVDEKTGISYQRNMVTGEIKQLDMKKTGKTGAGGSGSPSGLEKEVEYLKSIGLPQETALDIATNSKQNPSASIITIAKVMAEAEGIPINEAIDTAKNIYQEKLGRKLTKSEANKIESAQLAAQIGQFSGANAKSDEVPIPMRRQPAQAPAAALEYLKANPDSAEFFKQKYGYLPE